MPTVRRIERQVSLTALPGVRKTAGATAESEGAGVELARGRLEATRAEGRARIAEAMAGFGERAATVGLSIYAQMEEEERQAADQTALLKASNRLSDYLNDRLYNPQGGAFTLKGEAALPLPEQIRGDFDKVAGEIETTLTTPDQKFAWARIRAQEWQSTDLAVRRHVSSEIEAFRASELKSHVENSVNAAIQNFADPKLFAIELQKATTAIRRNAPSLGFGPEAVEAQVKAVQSQAHLGAIANLLARDQDQAAQAWFDAAKDQIAGDQWDTVQKALEEGTLRKQSQKAADDIIRAGGTLAEQREKAKAIDNADVRDQTLQYVEHDWDVNRTQAREQDAALSLRAYNVFEQSGWNIRVVERLPYWTRLDPDVRNSMQAIATRKAKGEPIETDPSTYYDLMQMAGDRPEEFATFNLMTRRHLLDEGDFKQLATLQVSIKAGDRNKTEKELAPFRTRIQLVDDTLTLHGIDPNAKPDTAEGKAIAQLRRMVDRRVEFLQAGGAKASNQDIQAEIDNLLSRSVTVPGSWWNIFPGGKPFWDEQKRLLELTIEDIPDSERNLIEAALRARNRPISDATVLDLYLETVLRSKK